MTNIHPMQLYIANVPFDEGHISKVRPALVIEVSAQRVIVFKITSQHSTKSDFIQRLYYPIKQWQLAGLNEPSYVDTHRAYALTRERVFAHRPIGELTLLDVVNLSTFLKQQHFL